jgi:hypothetical protein
VDRKGLQVAPHIKWAAAGGSEQWDFELVQADAVLEPITAAMWTTVGEW